MPGSLSQLFEEHRGDLDAFNAQAHEMQRAAGVDPADCMDIVECPVSTVWGGTPVPHYLEFLNRGLYPTLPPEDDAGRFHDEILHFGFVASTHPAIVQAVRRAAGIARRDYDKGKIDMAEIKADKLDRVLSRKGVRALKIDELDPKAMKRDRKMGVGLRPADLGKLAIVEGDHIRTILALGY